MPVKGYIDYKRRKFCKDIKCPVQLELDSQKEGSEEYDKTRNVCKASCKYTTYQFHHWLIEKGYLIVRPKFKKPKHQTSKSQTNPKPKIKNPNMCLDF